MCWEVRLGPIPRSGHSVSAPCVLLNPAACPQPGILVFILSGSVGACPLPPRHCGYSLSDFDVVSRPLYFSLQTPSSLSLSLSSLELLQSHPQSRDTGQTRPLLRSQAGQWVRLLFGLPYVGVSTCARVAVCAGGCELYCFSFCPGILPSLNF